MMKKLIAAPVMMLMLAACGGPKDGADILVQHPKSEIVPMLKSARQNKECVTFLQFSDIHGSAQNLERIVEFRDAYSKYIDDAIHTGDIVTCFYDDPNIFDTVPGSQTILNTIGNHDCWKCHIPWTQTDFPYDATKQDTYTRFFIGADPSKPTIANWNVCQPSGVADSLSADFNACYYYKDYPKARLRVFVLDCMHYDAAQNAWLQSILADALEKGYAAMGVTHYQPEFGLTPYEPDLTPDGTDLPAQSDPTAKQIESMPDAAYADVDAFIDGGGLFLCWLSGHWHYDYIGRICRHERQLDMVITKSGNPDEYMYDKREAGTPSQDAFDLITYNPVAGTVTFDRIGCADGWHGRRQLILNAAER